jgi:hypothetical protein
MSPDMRFNPDALQAAHEPRRSPWAEGIEG